MDIATSLPHTKRYTNLWGLWLDVCSKTANHISCGRIACHNICVSDSVIWHYFGQSCAQFGGALPYNLKAALTISKRTFGFEVHILLLHQESYTITGHLAAGGGDVAMVRVLAPHCCGPSLISGPGVESGLS